MFDYVNAEAFSKTMASYSDAMQRMLAISPRVSPDSRPMDGLPLRWRMDWSTLPYVERVPYVTRIFVNRESLFEYGRPKINVAHMTIMRLSAHANFKFEVYGVRGPIAASEAYTDTDGNEHPARPRQPEQIHANSDSITLKLFDTSWTVGAWRTAQDMIVHLLDAAPAHVRDEFAVEIGKANAEIERYNAAIQALATI